MLTHEEAKKFYDRFGSKQDWQRFYESRAVDDLIAHLKLNQAQSVFEFGCGTGRLAEILLDHFLPVKASYTGVDISTTIGLPQPESPGQIRKPGSDYPDQWRIKAALRNKKL